MKSTLEKCHGKTEVQRALGEVWGVGVMRRLKIAGRERVVAVLLGDEGADNGNAIQDACAWMFVSACSVSLVTFMSFAPGISEWAPLTVRIANNTHINDLDNFTAFIVLSHNTIGTILHSVETCTDGTYSPCQVCRTVCTARRSARREVRANSDRVGVGVVHN